MKIRMLILSAVLVFMAISPALAFNENFGATLLGGHAWSTESDVLEGRDGYTGPVSSSFESAWTLGAEGFWRPSPTVSIGLGLQHWDMTAEAARTGGGSESDFISVSSTPVYAFIRYMKPLEKGLTWHAEAGLGFAFNDGSGESGLNTMAAATGQAIDVEADNGPCFFLGLGADYFFNPRVNLGISLRHWWLAEDYDLTGSTLGTFQKGEFDARNLQLLFSLTFWFGK